MLPRREDTHAEPTFTGTTRSGRWDLGQELYVQNMRSRQQERLAGSGAMGGEVNTFLAIIRGSRVRRRGSQLFTSLHRCDVLVIYITNAGPICRQSILRELTYLRYNNDDDDNGDVDDSYADSEGDDFTMI
ncbi:hypothetical protein PoB_005791200 [Plakobranchus ocellatus]|uniref:Uncharacterized protein n=1 Tax=Plakobranchus ocellatus TaxID=259542 RepID=A0AAV4CID1_9GAST|nr:hypothetical protein PoB_005791200 [Plakobranchus ocellatus]